MLFWTKEEYLKFSEAIQDKPISYYAFQVLYWTGIRCGELLALTKQDFDLEKRTLRINKTYQVVKGEELVTDPKTEKSNRTIDLPRFLSRYQNIISITKWTEEVRRPVLNASGFTTSDTHAAHF